MHRFRQANQGSDPSGISGEAYHDAVRRIASDSTGVHRAGVLDWEKRTSRRPRKQTDWADYFRSLGMVFPNGGFAAYHPESEVLVIANTEEQLRLLDPL